ncbi:hypothetical protein BBO_01542 [Beauveria brongniartii RCEF 3172]|uniref:Uncharacterized protein n=1 Tax=Beauveria brongniartii RCEF 3172 TaxID=1081107 RepID=A0A167J838_9HYPO|nr:hypothetical protein BBO_01542 [Beauveria brongniartii RCEF 3172]
MKPSLLLAVVCASLVSAKKKPKTKTTRILFTPTFLRKHFTKGWRDLDQLATCEHCKNICAVAPVPKWLDEYWACIKFKCNEKQATTLQCDPTDWGEFPKTTANATSTSTTAASNNATSATPAFITITSTTAPGPTSSLATISSTSSVTAKASTATSSSSHSLPLRPSFITSMVQMRMSVEDEDE